MNIIRFSSALAIVLMLGSFATADVTLDDFEDGSLFWASLFSDGNTYSSESALPGAAGSTRLIQHAPNGTSGSSFIQSQVTGGSLNITYADSDIVGFGVIHGIYGGLAGIPASGSGAVEGSQLLPINPSIDLSTETELRLDYTYNGFANGGVINFYAFGPNLEQNQFDQSQNFFLASGSGQVVLDLTTFFNNVDPSQVVGIGFLFVSLFDGDASFHHFEATGGVSTVTVVPDEVEVTRGSYVSGGLAELSTSDNADYSASRSSSDIQSKVEIELKGSSPSQAPGGLEFTVESSVFARSTVNQFIDLWNYDTGAWEEVASGTATRFTDSTMTAVPTGDLSRFVELGTGCMEARVRYASGNQRQQFTANVDHTFWTIQ